MPGLNPAVDPDGLLEYSVVFTDRALNHMSNRFQGVMRDLSEILRTTYSAHAVAIVPGGGTYGMESVARQFGTDAHCMVLRNGWFSFRWSEIFAMGRICSRETVLKARPVGKGPESPFAPAPIDEVVATIARERPDVVFAPHVETAAGMILPDDYLTRVAAAVHEVGGLFVLDCIASGTVWVDMAATGVDVLISAPQKGWSGPPCAALVMLSERAAERLGTTTSTSYATDLKRWRGIMQAYENGGHAYHATMPTDALTRVRDAMVETRAFGLERACKAQWALGRGVRELMAGYGWRSVAADGFAAPGVVVSYTRDPDMQNARRFVGLGLQTAAGVPLRCDEPEGFSTFRIGLFGLDKLAHVERTIDSLRRACEAIAGEKAA